MTYAPVLIPTLNRYEHLRQCLESLSKCTLADETEVYIALDYPPSEKYVEGWQKAREYLYSIQNMNFKKIHLIERTENYGTWNLGDKGNVKYLIADISEKYDRYIFTEDDNVFAPNFLEYMNKGLDLFEDDKNVYAISGYRWWFPIIHDENTYFRQSGDYTPWGIGRWVKKEKELIQCSWFKSQLTYKNIVRFLVKKDYYTIGSMFEFASNEHENDILVDAHMRVYMNIKNMHMIIPTTQLVRNIGLDGSGCSMPQNSQEIEVLYNQIPLSTDKHFHFKGNGYEYFTENNHIYRKGKEWQGQWYYFKRMIKKVTKYIIKG